MKLETETAENFYDFYVTAQISTQAQLQILLYP